MQLRALGMASGWRAAWAASLLAILIVCEARAQDESALPAPQGPGLLKMCPPGGEAFTTAWQMTCGMRRRKRNIVASLERAAALKRVALKDRRAKRAESYRPLSLTEMMNYCCGYGCSFRDLLPYCDPFGQWDSK